MATITLQRKLEITEAAFKLVDGFHAANWMYHWDHWFGVGAPYGMHRLPDIGLAFFKYCCWKIDPQLQPVVVPTSSIPIPRVGHDPVLSWLRPFSLIDGSPVVEINPIAVDVSLNAGTLSMQSYPRCHAYACNSIILHEAGHFLMHYDKILLQVINSRSLYVELDPMDDAEAWCFASAVMSVALSERAYFQKLNPGVPQLTPFRAMANAR